MTNTPTPQTPRPPSASSASCAQPAPPGDRADRRSGRLDHRRQRGGDEEAAEAPPGAPRIVSPAELGEAAAASAAPIYWAGERPGAELELSEVAAAAPPYVRYLTGGAQGRRPQARVPRIGTYELPNAYAALRANAKRTGAKLRKAPGGACAWQDPASPTSVYLAKPGEDFQVEVYNPSPKEALEVALSPDLQPVPTG